MSVDPEIAELVAQAAQVAARNAASAVFARIDAVKTRRKNEETIAELEAIVTELISDKQELVQISQAYEQELVAQRLASSDIQYLTDNLIPIVEDLIKRSTKAGSGATLTPQEMIEFLKSILSVETVTILQLIGFNFRKAIGDPLTSLVAGLIGSKSPVDNERLLQLQGLQHQHQIAYIEMVRNPEAYARFVELQDRSS
jgi:hypothetical protein